VETLAEEDRQEERVGATEMTDRVGLAIEIAIEAMMIAISTEVEEIADSEAVVAAVGVVHVMLIKKVTAQEVHHAGFLMKKEAMVVAVMAVVECAMTIKAADATGVILVDFHMKVVLIEIDEEVVVDVEMEEWEAEIEMVVGIVMEEQVDRTVAMIQ